MPSSLRARLNELASSFASSVLDAIRGASIDELTGESRGGRRGPSPASGEAATARSGAGRRRAGRLPRRSAGDIAQVIERIVALLRQSPKGLRAEQIRQKLGLQAKELPRPLKEALDGGRLGKSGQKRATTYVITGAAPPAAAASRSKAGGSKARAKRAGKRPAARAKK